jgi:hypothetical protein
LAWAVGLHTACITSFETILALHLLALVSIPYSSAWLWQLP